MTAPEWMLFWSMLLATPPEGEWALTEERLMSCWRIDEQIYQYVRPAELSDLSVYNFGHNSELCESTFTCHPDPEIIGVAPEPPVSP